MKGVTSTAVGALNNCHKPVMAEQLLQQAWLEQPSNQGIAAKGYQGGSGQLDPWGSERAASSPASPSQGRKRCPCSFCSCWKSRMPKPSSQSRQGIRKKAASGCWAYSTSHSNSEAGVSQDRRQVRRINRGKSR